MAGPDAVPPSRPGCRSSSPAPPRAAAPCARRGRGRSHRRPGSRRTVRRCAAACLRVPPPRR
ncbi:hypothetical protein I549_5774 [Mycobacterium avium subsp. avium 2285 (R)]|nr:hypothetical protein I549_5774 [Mycobacterium avium subsp. avium 2285 (R)]